MGAPDTIHRSGQDRVTADMMVLIRKALGRTVLESSRSGVGVAVPGFAFDVCLEMPGTSRDTGASMLTRIIEGREKMEKVEVVLGGHGKNKNTRLVGSLRS